MIDFHPLLTAFQTARRDLLALREPAGHWVGEISSSPFATASAGGALCSVAKQVKEDARRDAYQQLAVRAVEWLAAAQTSEGGWGDTRSGPANAAATTAARAAIHLAGQSQRFADGFRRRSGISIECGGVAEMRRQYRADPELLAAVLGMSALADLSTWRNVPALAFERAWLPRDCGRGAAPPRTPNRSAWASVRRSTSTAGRGSAHLVDTPPQYWPQLGRAQSVATVQRRLPRVGRVEWVFGDGACRHRPRRAPVGSSGAELPTRFRPR